MFMPELHSFRFRELSHVLYDRSPLPHDFAQRPRYIQNLRHAFPVREMWFSVMSFDPKKFFISFASLVVEGRDSLQVLIIGIQKRPYLREGSDVVVHVLHFCVSNTCDSCSRILQFGGGLPELVRQNSGVMFLNRKRDGEDCD